MGPSFILPIQNTRGVVLGKFVFYIIKGRLDTKFNLIVLIQIPFIVPFKGEVL